MYHSLISTRVHCQDLTYCICINCLSLHTKGLETKLNNLQFPS